MYPQKRDGKDKKWHQLSKIYSKFFKILSFPRKMLRIKVN